MIGDLTLLNRLSLSMKPPFRKTLLCTLAVVATGTAHGDDETRTPRLQLPCLAELVAHARSGEGPLAFEEAFFDGPYARATGDDLIERGYAYLHGFWNAAAERSFREAYQRDHESVEALIGLALTNIERPRRFDTFLAKAEAVARHQQNLSEENRWWLRMLRVTEPAERRRLLEARVATSPSDPLPTLWMARNEILEFHRRKTEPGSRAAWDRLLASMGSPAAATYRRLLWANDPPDAELPNLTPLTDTATADDWRIAGEFEKGRNRLEEALTNFVGAVRADLNWLDGRLAMPDEAQNLGANSAGLATLLADLGRYQEATEIARRFRALPYFPDGAGTTQPWRRLEDTCRKANTQALENLHKRLQRQEEIRTAIDDNRLEDALKLACEDRQSRPWAFDATAQEIEILWRLGDRKAALFGFDQAFRQRLSRADVEWRTRPVFTEMTVVMGLDEIEPEKSDSTDLDELIWLPPRVPESTLKDRAFSGKPDRATVVIFFLGAGCPRCVEQLTTFLPYIEAFSKAGVDVIGISTDAPENTDEAFPIPLYSDADLTLFQSFGVFDEFAERPLHGTFLIDGNGAVCWREIGNTAFLRPQFLINELPTLLKED